MAYFITTTGPRMTHIEHCQWLFRGTRRLLPSDRMSGLNVIHVAIFRSATVGGPRRNRGFAGGQQSAGISGLDGHMASLTLL